MSFSAKKVRFLADFSFVSRHAFWLKQLVLVEEFLLGEAKLEHGTEFFNHSKNSFKEGRIKTTGRVSFAFGSRFSIQM